MRRSEAGAGRWSVKALLQHKFGRVVETDRLALVSIHIGAVVSVVHVVADGAEVARATTLHERRTWYLHCYVILLTSVLARMLEVGMLLVLLEGDLVLLAVLAPEQHRLRLNHLVALLIRNRFRIFRVVASRNEVPTLVVLASLLLT